MEDRGGRAGTDPAEDLIEDDDERVVEDRGGRAGLDSSRGVAGVREVVEALGLAAKSTALVTIELAFD